MKRYKQRMSGLLMALGLTAALPVVADEVVATAAGGWFAVDSREVKDTTLSGGAIVGGATNVVLQSSPNAWGEAGGGTSATITWAGATGSGTVAEATTAGEVAWTPEVKSGTATLTYVSGSVTKTAQLLVAVQVGDGAVARIRDGVCTISGTGAMADCEAGKSPLWGTTFDKVVIGDGVTSVGRNFFAYMKGVRDVEIGGSVTNVAQDAFYFCRNLTNLVVGAGVQSVGTNAFERCNALESIVLGRSDIAGMSEAFSITSRITMVGDKPVVDTVPVVSIKGFKLVLKGCENLGDDWETVEDPTDIPAKYHFFKFEFEAE